MLGLGSVAGVVSAAVETANDPYLEEVICRAGQLKAVDAGAAVPSCPNTADNLPGGIGLYRAVKPLRAYVYAEQHKWIYAVAALGIIGLPLLIGFELGKGK